MTIAATRTTIERIRRLAISHGFVADVGLFVARRVPVCPKSFLVSNFVSKVFLVELAQSPTPIWLEISGREGATSAHVQRCFSG